MNTGIYKISAPSGKFYIGSTVSFSNRWKHHRNTLRRNIHSNSHLQNAWNKYGEASFVFEKMLICTKEDLIFYEQRFIDVLKPEFNIAKFAMASMQGRQHSQETLLKMSEAAKNRSPEWGEKLSARQAGTDNPMHGRTGDKHPRFGKKSSPETCAKISAVAKLRTGENSQCGRPVLCVELNRIFATAGLAMDWLREQGLTTSKAGHIGAVCAGKRPIAYSFHWKYPDQPTVDNQPVAP